MSRTHDRRRKGISLAKGPVGLIGLALLAYGVTGLIFGSSSFTSRALDGTVSGDTWLGIEGNGWTNVLAGGAGALLLFGSPLHWGAKSLSMLVGLALGAAAIIALADDRMDVLGIFAVNDATIIALGIAAGVLVLLSLLPRVGRRDERDHVHREAHVERHAAAPVVTEPRVAREPIDEREPAPRTGRFTREPAAEEQEHGAVREERVR